MEKIMTVRSENSIQNIQVVGAVDEVFNKNVAPVDFKMSSVIDLGKLSLINSTGIREWINWIGQFGSTSLVFTNCPKIFIDQINMINGLIPENSIVESFQVPYFNENEDKEHLFLAVQGQHYTKQKIEIPEAITINGTAFELDVMPAKYFKFISKFGG
jgi:hypothetical protein